MHNHEHGHSHGGHHHHIGPGAKVNNAFIIGIVLNSLFVVIQAIAGFVTHSMALLSDAGHNLSDVASLALSLFAFRLARRSLRNHSPTAIRKLPYLRRSQMQLSFAWQ